MIHLIALYRITGRRHFGVLWCSVKFYPNCVLIHTNTVPGLYTNTVCHPSCAVLCLRRNPPQPCLVGDEHRQPGRHGVARGVSVLEK